METTLERPLHQSNSTIIPLLLRHLLDALAIPRQRLVQTALPLRARLLDLLLLLLIIVTLRRLRSIRMGAVFVLDHLLVLLVLLELLFLGRLGFTLGEGVLDLVDEGFALLLSGSVLLDPADGEDLHEGRSASRFGGEAESAPWLVTTGDKTHRLGDGNAVVKAAISVD
ncbi:hypothetical protein BCR35DRAFT_203604 [Leucosporidium creatinivorum]|uniref:Uncharacterized protein n=1 Tax=Leucosporidium creatinivorum TaxID=106004 RepID=A0A1Y2DGV6_9BASI|nr:hypothetical protein BCR35DRAFT_203604 [Leucosporidium creatinivorum]